MDAFKRAGLPHRGDWWREYGRWLHTTQRRHARRRLRRALRVLRADLIGVANLTRLLKF